MKTRRYLGGQGHHHQHVEQTVEVPVHMTQEQVVHVPKVPITAM